MTEETKSPEQLAHEAAQLTLQKEQEKLAKKEAADKVRAEKKVASDTAKAEKKALRDAEVAAKKAAKLGAETSKDAEKAAKDKAKEDAKAAREAAKTANQMPEQNGIRRPKPGTLCGQAWGVMDNESAKIGQPVSIAATLAVTSPMGLVDGNVKAEYARWRKFNGVTGRVHAPAAEVPVAAPGAAGTMPPAAPDAV